MKYLEKTGLSIIFIILFHALGFIGFCLPYFHEFLISFVPFHLLLMGAILIANQKQFNKRFWLCFILVVLIGFTIDVFIVSSANIFGQYTYSDHLGYKIADVPLIVGVNWLILIFTVGSILKRRFKHQRNLKSIIGAVAILLIDFLMEPVAQHFNFRTWENNTIPIQNYVATFIVSFILLRIYHEIQFRKSNPVALPLIVCEVLFLIGMNVTIA